MNTLEIKGGRKDQREMAHRVVGFMINTMMPRMRTLDIEVEFVNMLVKRWIMVRPMVVRDGSQSLFLWIQTTMIYLGKKKRIVCKTNLPICVGRIIFYD